MIEIFSPLILYYVLSMGLSAVLPVLCPILARPESAMWFLALENFLMLPVFYGLFQRDRRPGKERTVNAKAFVSVILTAIFLSRGVNLVLSLTALPRLFSGYEAIADRIYGCSFLSQFMASVASAALLEELLMRGIVYNRLKKVMMNQKGALVGSALFFAVFHGNVLQGVYAFFLGLLFAWIYESQQSLPLAVAAHMAANTASILSQRVSVWEAVQGSPLFLSLLAAGYLLAGGFFLRRLRRRS